MSAHGMLTRMRFCSFSLDGLWSSLANLTRPSLTRTLRESPQLPIMMCVGVMKAVVAVLPLRSAPLDSLQTRYQ